MQDIAAAALGKLVAPDTSVGENILDRYAGRYNFAANPKEYVLIYKQKGRLYADLSNRTGRHMLLQAETPTRFVLPDVQRIRTTIEFQLKDGQVTGLIWTQEKAFPLVRAR